MKKLVKLCLHLDYIVQNSFHFHGKLQNSNFSKMELKLIFPYRFRLHFRFVGQSTTIDPNEGL